MLHKYLGVILCGAVAGAINGLFGGGGGMVLVPFLTWLTDLEEDSIFPASVCIILPICLISLSITLRPDALPWPTTLPYLFGSAAGGILSGLVGKRIPTNWLHKALGILILWGGIRYLC